MGLCSNRVVNNVINKKKYRQINPFHCCNIGFSLSMSTCFCSAIVVAAPLLFCFKEEKKGKEKRKHEVTHQITPDMIIGLVSPLYGNISYCKVAFP